MHLCLFLFDESSRDYYIVNKKKQKNLIILITYWLRNSLLSFNVEQLFDKSSCNRCRVSFHADLPSDINLLRVVYRKYKYLELFMFRIGFYLFKYILFSIHLWSIK